MYVLHNLLPNGALSLHSKANRTQSERKWNVFFYRRLSNLSPLIRRDQNREREKEIERKSIISTKQLSTNQTTKLSAKIFRNRYNNELQCAFNSVQLHEQHIFETFGLRSVHFLSSKGSVNGELYYNIFPHWNEMKFKQKVTPCLLLLCILALTILNESNDVFALFVLEFDKITN